MTSKPAVSPAPSDEAAGPRLRRRRAVPLPDQAAIARDFAALGVPAPTPWALPSWAVPELIATEAARARLAAWCAAGARPVEPAAVLRRLRYIGDPELLAVVRESLLSKVAPPAALHILEHYLVLGTGWSSGGFCSCVAAPGGALLRLIMLSGAGQDAAKVASYLAHELAHGWLEPDPQRPCAAEDAAVEGAWLALRGARGDELVRGVERQQFEAELRADSLALRWGARREHLDSAHLYREHFAREGAGLLAAYGPGR